MNKGKISIALNLLVDILFRGPQDFEAIKQALDQAGISERTARTVKSKLGIKSLKFGGRGQGWKWSFPDDILQPLKSFAAFEIPLPEEINRQVKEADHMAIKARILAQSGDPASATQLRISFDQIYADIWSKIEGKGIGVKKVFDSETTSGRGQHHEKYLNLEKSREKEEYGQG